MRGDGGAEGGSQPLVDANESRRFVWALLSDSDMQMSRMTSAGSNTEDAFRDC
jgi:hypothetical protein